MTTKKKPTPKRGASRYQAPAKKPVPGWVWLACGLIIGGFFMFLFSLEPGRNEVKRPQPKQTKQTARPEPNKPKYDFYTLLPESEVIVPPEAIPPELDESKSKPVTAEEAAKIDTARAQAALNGETPPPPPVVAQPPSAIQAPLTTQYFLQAGSFRKHEDADRVRAQILMLGQNVQVESGKVREETWHRVLVGPFASRTQLSAAQKQLADSGFSNLLLQRRQIR